MLPAELKTITSPPVPSGMVTRLGTVAFGLKLRLLAVGRVPPAG